MDLELKSKTDKKLLKILCELLYKGNYEKDKRYFREVEAEILRRMEA